MAKGLAFGGNGLCIVIGSRVCDKETKHTGEVVGIKFGSNNMPSKFQIKWDDTGLVNWVNAKTVR